MEETKSSRDTRVTRVVCWLLDIASCRNSFVSVFFCPCHSIFQRARTVGIYGDGAASFSQAPAFLTPKCMLPGWNTFLRKSVLSCSISTDFRSGRLRGSILPHHP